MQNSPGATVLQSGRDIIVDGSQSRTTRIQSIVIEGRLTCTLKPGAEIPPPEVPFLPIGGVSASLKGPGGRAEIEFASPVRFRRLEDERVVVINRFALPSQSDLQNTTIEHLLTFNALRIPSVTVVYGKSLARMNLLEVTMSVNGQDAWSYRYILDAAFQEGPVFSLPLDSLSARLAK